VENFDNFDKNDNFVAKLLEECDYTSACIPAGKVINKNCNFSIIKNRYW